MVARISFGRDATDVISADDYYEEETNRLAYQSDYEDNGPGEGDL